MASLVSPSSLQCSGCAKCCSAHPCALEPDDLEKIGRFLGLSEGELFNRYLVIDYIETQRGKQFYICPARKADKPGTLVEPNWTFSDSPCIFLNGTVCSIQDAKPRGGSAYYCRLLTNSAHGVTGYGKKRSAKDWARRPVLREFLSQANKKSKQN